MAHSNHSPYSRLIDRLNRSPLGAPPSPLLYRILALLFSEKDAERAAALPIRPFTARHAARAWNISMDEARGILDDLADRTLLLDLMGEEETYYLLPPPMAGFFEFALMRVREDVDQQVLSELLYEYLNVDDEFVRALFLDGETKLGRVLVQEQGGKPEPELFILEHERATEVVGGATDIGIGLCYCRHKMSRVGKGCRAPMEICMALNAAARSLIRHGAVRRVGRHEALELLEDATEHNLVQIAENVREGVNFLCHCCACCCEALVAGRKLGMVRTVQTSPLLPEISGEKCTGCGRCAGLCPVGAITMETDRVTRGVVAEELCLGCGICGKQCPGGAITLEMRSRRLITPRNSFHRTVLMAVERGTLHHLLFDGQVLANHRILASMAGALLRLSPVKRALARRQVPSRCLEKLAERLKPH